MKQETLAQGASGKQDDYGQQHKGRDSPRSKRTTKCDKTTECDKSTENDNKPTKSGKTDRNETKHSDMTLRDRPKRQTERPKRLIVGMNMQRIKEE